MIQSARPEGGEEYRWRRIVHHFWMVGCRLQQYLFHLVQIRAIGHPESDHHASGGIRERPVDQTLGHKRFVRDDHLFTIEVGNGGRTNADLADGPGESTDGDGIADTHRTFEQDNQARDKVTEDLLQAEAQTHRQRRRQPLEFIPRDAQRAEYRHRPDNNNDIVQDGGNGVRRPLTQVQP